MDLLKEKEKYGQADETKCSESECLLVLDLRLFRTRTEGEWKIGSYPTNFKPRPWHMGKTKLLK